MWDFLQYTSREQTFNGLSWGFLEAAKAGAGVRVRAQVSKTALKIRYKSFSSWNTLEHL